jgi:hypothetical protein
MAGVKLPVSGSYIYTVLADITGATYGIYSPASAATITNPGFSVSGGAAVGDEGILIKGGAGDITNETGGTISGDVGVTLTDGGSVTNDSGATIKSSGYVAVYSNLTAPVSVVNAGTITGETDGVALLGGGSVTNNAGATITGTTHYGVYVASSPTVGASVTNAGSITGAPNAISFGPIGGPTTSPTPPNPGGANTVTLEGGSSLSGNVIGSVAPGATNTLILDGTGTTGSLFVNFGTVEEGAGASWTLSGVSTFATADITGNSSTLSLAGGATTAVISGASDTFTESVSSSTITISGTSDNVTVTGNNNTITVENSSSTTLNVTGTGNIEIWAPTISGTVANQATTSEAPVKPFSGVTIGDKTSGESDSDTLTITVGGTGGTLTGTGLVAGASGVYTITGSASTITSDLDALSFTPTAGAPNTMSTTTFKLSDVTSVYSTAAVDTTTSVVDTDPAGAPTITGTVANQTTSNEAPVKPFSGVTIADANSGATDTLTITLGGSGGTLTGTGLVATGTAGVYTLSGSASTITSELEALSFTPTAGAAGTSSTTTFKLSDLSSASSTAAVNTTTSVVDTDSGVPVPNQTDVAIQNQVTGQVDYLQYTGSTLTSSALYDYGLGSDWKIVASLASNVLVAQSQSTGYVDILTLNANGSLAASAMSNVGVAPIIGEASAYGPALVSQTSSGLDFLQFSAQTGKLTGSDLVPGTAGLPKAVGVASSFSGPEFLGVGTGDSVVTQLANGEIDLIGFSGGFGALAFSASDLLSHTIGLPSVGAVNQQAIGNENIQFANPGPQSLQLIGNAGGNPDAMYIDTGLRDLANAGSFVGSNLLNLSLAGWNIVDAAGVAASLFPVKGQV